MPLQDSDNFIIGRGTESYKITYQDLKDDLNYVPPPVGTIDTPTVLEPNEGAGGGDVRYLKSDAITEIEGGGIHTCETDTIESVNQQDATNIATVNVQGTINFDGNIADVRIPVNPTTLSFAESVNIGAGDSSTGGDIRLYYVKLPVESVIGFRRNSNGQSGRMDVLCYWNGSEWIVDDVNSSTTASGTFLKAKTSATYFVAFRPETNISSFVIGQPIPTNGANIDAKIFGYSMSSYTFTADDVTFPTTLTFPSSNGFDCFEPGDVVQGGFTYDMGGGTATTSFNISNGVSADVIMDGIVDNTNNRVVANASNMPGTVTCTPTNPVPAGSEISLVFALGNVENSFTYSDAITLTGINGFPINALNFDKVLESTLNGNSALGVWKFPPGVDATSFTFRIGDSSEIGGNNPVIWGFAVEEIPPAKVISKDESANTITVDGGTWTTSDKLVKETPYDTTLTVAGSTDLADMSGSVFSTDGTGAPGPYTQTPYKLTTTDIESVSAFNPSAWIKWVENPFFNQAAGGHRTLDDSDGNAVFDPDTSGGYGVRTMNRNFPPAIGFNFENYGLTPTGPFTIASKAYVGEGGSIAALTNVRAVNFCLINYADGTDESVAVNVGNDYMTTATIPDNGKQVKSALFYFHLNGQDRSNYATVVESFFIDGDQVVGSTGTLLTFPGAVSTNPDLQYFRADDEVQPGVKVISTGYPNSNTMVVDGGTWGNDSQVWSASNTGYAEPAINSFDGNLTSASSAPASANARCEVTFGQITASKIEVHAVSQGAAAANGTYFATKFDDTDVTYVIPGAQSAGWYTVYDGNPISIKKLGATRNASGEGSGHMAWRVDGLVLLDTSNNARGHVEYQTKGGQGDIVSVNTDDNTLLISNTGDRDNRWIAENKAATDFYVAGPSIIDEPLLTNQVDLRGSDFATTPPDVDTLKEIVWSINGVEYSAGTTNPWKPLNNLPTNSTVTVKVKYKGNTLEDSDWSPDVTFTTGASLRSLFTRLAALEADEVTDDATDTALLTLIAGLAARIQTLEESN